jgi:hypothetical protein
MVSSLVQWNTKDVPKAALPSAQDQPVAVLSKSADKAEARPARLAQGERAVEHCRLDPAVLK